MQSPLVLVRGTLAEIQPADVDPIHRDIAVVVRHKGVLEREMLRDFAIEIAAVRAPAGTILESTILTKAVKAANAAWLVT